MYRPRGIDVPDQYDAKHAMIYGRFRIERITEVVEKFILCGDYSQPQVPPRVGIARPQSVG